jgi:hypothetical protein
MNYRVLSAPVRLHWAGFETDTLSLARAGWDISAEQDVMNCRMRIAIRHELGGMYGLSEGIDWDYQMHAHCGPRPDRLPVVPLRMVSQKIIIEAIRGKVPTENYFAMDPIDPFPQYVQSERKSLADLVHFASARARGILLPEASVQELMEQILKVQQPMREAEIKRDLLEKPHTVHAQLISLAA